MSGLEEVRQFAARVMVKIRSTKFEMLNGSTGSPP